MKIRLITTCLIAASSLALWAQHYKISGVAPKGAKKIYLYNISSSVTDSTKVNNQGTFSFEGDAKGDMFAMLIDNVNNKSINVILDGNIQANLEKEEVGGTMENDKMQIWDNKIITQKLALNAGVEKYRQLTAQNKTAEADSIRGKIEEMYQHLVQSGVEMCDENLNSVFPALFLAQMANSIPREKLVYYYNSKAKFLDVSLTKPLASMIEVWKKTMPGEMFTDVEEPDTAGISRKLSDYAGKGNYVLVDFWASWCGPCMAEMPNVKALYDKYHNKGFDVVGLSFDQNKKAWLGAIHRLGLKWHHLSDLKGWKTQAGQAYGVHSIPYTVLLGPDGKIVATNLRGEELANKLAEIYK